MTYRSTDNLQLIALAATKIKQPIVAERYNMTVLPPNYFGQPVNDVRYCDKRRGRFASK